MEVKQVAALPERIAVMDMEMMEDVLTITAVSLCPHPCCPLCGKPSTRTHSRYLRQVADLPCGGQQVRLFIQVRKCFCDAPDCARKIFIERLTPFVDPFARVTRRLYHIVQIIGLATGGRLGVRVTDRLEIQTSRHTILRRIMALPTEPVGEAPQIGIDDFSFRRGRKFGTIIVDLQTHKVLDVLPDRTADTSAAWMAIHPEIELVSRDRGGDYAAAARKAAPQATQTADRFHIVKNMSEAVEKALARCRAEIRKNHQEKVDVAAAVTKARNEPLLSSDGKPYSARQSERHDRYQQVVDLRKQGMRVKEIASRVGMGERTVRSWLKQESYPETHHRVSHRSRFDAYATYVQQRWDQGCHNVEQLYREIKAQGYPHSARALRYIVEPLREKAKANLPNATSLDHFSAKEAVWLFIRAIDDLDEKEREELATIRQESGSAETIYQLVQVFLEIVRKRHGEQLETWLESVRASRIPELHRFANGLEQDKAAVVAGLTLPQNNGLVEGKVNKVKLIKRMGYGRAAFPLLCQRVLHAL